MSRVTLAEPELYQLAVNYRSHSGIVNCAHSVIELITKFWPNSIDRLAPEVGIVHGFKPVFFSKEDPDQLERFLFGDVESPIEFGAHQCKLNDSLVQSGFEYSERHSCTKRRC